LRSYVQSVPRSTPATSARWGGLDVWRASLVGDRDVVGARLSAGRRGFAGAFQLTTDRVGGTGRSLLAILRRRSPEPARAPGDTDGRVARGSHGHALRPDGRSLPGRSWRSASDMRVLRPCRVHTAGCGRRPHPESRSSRHGAPGTQGIASAAGSATARACSRRGSRPASWRRSRSKPSRRPAGT
jgi:hypothetical protein